MSEQELEPLITECPSCHTRFRVTEPQLERARGRVRCGACLTVFDGVAALTFESARAFAEGCTDPEQAERTLDEVLDELGADAVGSADGGVSTPPPTSPPRTFQAPIFAGFEEDEAASAAPAAGTTGAVANEPTNEPANAPADAPEDVPDPAASAEARTAEGTFAAAVPETPEPAPAVLAATAPPAEQPLESVGEPLGDLFAERFGEPGPSIRRRVVVWGGILLGLLALAGQVMWYRFDDWAKQPEWRGVYAAACDVLGCSLPVQRDTGLLKTHNMVVRSHPSRHGALLVDAVIVNEAEFAQPFPVLELRFTTVRGILVAGRRFRPGEYLAGDAEGMTLMPPRTPVQIALTIEDPGPDAVNYFLRFR